MPSETNLNSNPSADPLEPLRYGVVAVVPREAQLMVIRRSEFVLAPRAICFPGGGIEPGESEPQALVREIREELNIDILPRRCLWRSVTAWRIALAWWLSAIPLGADPAPNPAEVEAVHWLTPDEIRTHPDLLQGNISFLNALASGEIQLS
ncbi:MAG TPA: NUDIX domain-containing protein [Pirellulales bacterium]|jgi:8-oxo-dGTP pyrophosphatase MutT (NUDIX family)|nr:NUDIX domain-containing protein [Pirellulales bacterium]